jgi:uncharacterized protein (DUF952 family)
MSADAARGRWGFRLVSENELAAFRSSGSFCSALDTRDGFIHCSPASALVDTCRIYYGGRPDVMLLRVDLNADILSTPPLRVQWDAVPSRACDFPHVYGGPLPLRAVERVWGPLAIDGVGAHELPSAAELSG